MLAISLILVLVMLSLVSWYTLKIKDISNPLFLFLLPLCAQMIIYYTFYRDTNPITTKTLLIWWLGIIGFTLGYHLLNYIGYESKNNKLYGYKKKTNYIFVWFCMIVGIFSIVYTKQYMSSLSGTVNIFDSVSLNIREAYIDSVHDAPFFVIYGKYLLLFSFLVILYDKLFNNIKISNLTVVILGALVVYNSTLTFSRTDLLLAVVSIFFVYLNYMQSIGVNQNNKNYLNLKKIYKKSRKNLMILIFLILLAFISLTNARSVNQSTFFNPQNQILQYIGKPIWALDYWVVDKPGESGDWLIFEPISKFLSILGINLDSGPSLAHRGQFNVYSYLKAPYFQFGTIGVLVIMLGVGFISNYLYKKYKTGSKYWVIFYAGYSYALIIAFFDWQFGITTYLYLVIFLLITSGINTVIIKKSKQIKV